MIVFRFKAKFGGQILKKMFVLEIGRQFFLNLYIFSKCLYFFEVYIFFKLTYFSGSVGNF